MRHLPHLRLSRSSAAATAFGLSSPGVGSGCCVRVASYRHGGRDVAQVRLHRGGGASHVTGSKQVEERAPKHGKQEGSLGGPPSGATQSRGLRGGENIQ